MWKFLDRQSVIDFEFDLLILWHRRGTLLNRWLNLRRKMIPYSCVMLFEMIKIHLKRILLMDHFFWTILRAQLMKCHRSA